MTGEFPVSAMSWSDRYDAIHTMKALSSRFDITACFGGCLFEWSTTCIVGLCSSSVTESSPERPLHSPSSPSLLLSSSSSLSMSLLLPLCFAFLNFDLAASASGKGANSASKCRLKMAAASSWDIRGSGSALRLPKIAIAGGFDSRSAMVSTGLGK